MSKIVFFSIPACGHTNPTIEVVRALTKRGHEVWYYSFNMFREKIESAGAHYISCDTYLPPIPKDFEERVGKDFTGLMGMVTDLTLGLNKPVCTELQKLKPDCIISDSLCIWGKLFARKLHIPMICSTTTFALNMSTAKLMKPGWQEMMYTLTGLPKIHAKLRLLKNHGYPVDNFAHILQNDNDTDTIVYTSREFQPMSEMFGDKFTFVGPSINDVKAEAKPKQRTLIYVSLGTVMGKNHMFYQNCIDALRNCDFDVVMSVGSQKTLDLLKRIPAEFRIKTSVPQLQVLQSADVFVTHCGMNSVNESIYYGVPMVLAPQQSEQHLVARRAQEVGAGTILKGTSPEKIRQAIQSVLNNKESFQRHEKIVADSFRAAGGPEKAADAIERTIHACQNEVTPKS